MCQRLSSCVITCQRVSVTDKHHPQIEALGLDMSKEDVIEQQDPTGIDTAQALEKIARQERLLAKCKDTIMYAWLR